MNEEELDYSRLTEPLAAQLPGLQEKLGAEREWWGNDVPGPHILFGDIVLPFVFDLIRSGSASGSLEAFFSFVERMAAHPDIRIRSIVETTIAPQICGDEAVLQRSRSLMGPELKRVCAKLLS